MSDPNQEYFPGYNSCHLSQGFGILQKMTKLHICVQLSAASPGEPLYLTAMVTAGSSPQLASQRAMAECTQPEAHGGLNLNPASLLVICLLLLQLSHGALDSIHLLVKFNITKKNHKWYYWYW